uniref:CRISPR system precrRNA processing endoribonuclease RAMP protein Cas6 n=1 Tax=Candidatus Electronema sp. TaxID=2698783 RepID=UPI004056FE68
MSDSSVQHLVFVRLRCRIQAETPLRLPEFSGSALRGGFGMALRRTACAQPQRSVCGDCLLRRQCVYSLIFETPVPENSELLRRCTAAPHPFVLEPPEDGPQELPPGGELDFGLTLIGRAADQLPWFILAFEALGRTGLGGKIGGGRGRFRLISVRQAERVLYQQGKLTAQPLPEAAPSAFPACGSLRVLFHTPTRIKYQEHFTERLDFHILFRSLLRRISLLSFFHCGQRLDDSGFADLVRQAESIATVSHRLRWHEQERWSGRQKARMQFGGLVGAVVYQGQLAPFLPYLALGEALHCGKGCTFGLGRCSVEWLGQQEENACKK